MLEHLINNKFTYKRLEEAEKKQRGILGRLVGVIADTKEPTRNGRRYSEELWENVFNDPIMKEKIENRCVLGELNHPEDRTEIEPEKVAICLAEVPKKGDDGKLYGVFDILNTPNGRILKALCDYGCHVGISSRGQGDLITDMDGNEAVDPDSYQCECFDVVLVPGVEAARPEYVTESLHNKKSLKQTLIESLNNSNESDKEIMKETLNNLNINLTESEETKESEEPKKEEAAKEKVKEKEVKEAKKDDEEESKEEAEDEESEDDAEEESKDEESEDEVDDNVELDDDEDDDDDDLDFDVEDTDEDDNLEISTVKDLVDTLGNFDKKSTVEIKNITIDDKEYEANINIDTDEDDDDKVNITIDCVPVEDEESEESKEENEEGDEEEAEIEIEPVDDEEEATEDEENGSEEEDEESSEEDKENSDDEEAEEGVKKGEEAIDDGAKILVDNLKEALKGKSDLENDVKSLQEKLAVSDAKVNNLTEENNRFKSAIARLSILAKSSKDLKESISTLEKSVSEKDEIIESQKSRISRLAESKKVSVDKANKEAEVKLTESLNSSKVNYEKQIQSLTEELKTTKNDSETKVKELNESLTKAKTIKESYRKLANKAVNKYIEIKANMLGLTSKDIKRKLGESYTMEDVDQICEDLKSYQLNISRLPFSIDRQVSVKVNEGYDQSKKFVDKHSKFDDDVVDEDLINLANLN